MKFKKEELSFEIIEKMINDNKIIKMNKNIKQILYNFINEDDKNKEILIKICGQKNYDFLINDLNNNLDNGENLNNMKNEIENKNIIIENKENIINMKSNSSFKKTNTIILIDNINSFNNSFLYSFIGKIIKKEATQILFLTSIDKIVILTEIGGKFKYFEENQFIYVSYVIFYSEKNGIIYFKMHDSSVIKRLDKIEEENPINQKIAIKFNLLDYNEYDFIFTQIGLELSKNNIKKFKLDKKIIFYVYDASKYDYEYFPQTIYLYDYEESFLDFKFFVYKSFLNEVNLFINQKYKCSYEFLYFSLDNSLPKEIEIEYQHNKNFKSGEFHTFNSKIRKSIIFINIPPQKKKDDNFGKNFLNIYLCTKEKIKLYGTFSLDSIKFKTKTPYKYKSVVKENIINIYKDYIDCYEKKNNPKEFQKYLLFELNVNKELENANPVFT